MPGLPFQELINICVSHCFVIRIWNNLIPAEGAELFVVSANVLTRAPHHKLLKLHPNDTLSIRFTTVLDGVRYFSILDIRRQVEGAKHLIVSGGKGKALCLGNAGGLASPK